MGEMIAAVVFIVIAVAAGVWVWWLERKRGCSISPAAGGLPT